MMLDNDLDISWIDKHNKLHNIDKNYCREPMDTISMHCIFVSSQNVIEKISSGKIDIIDNRIPKEKILKIIQDNKSMSGGDGGGSGAKYKLLDIMVYNVDLESQYIQEFVQNDSIDNGRFCKICPIVDDIVIMPSIFIFHSLNAIYFMFQEIEVVLNPVIKPILKIGGDNIKKHTKKVRICEPIERSKNKTKYARHK
jgi:hypothetical protein